MHSFFCSFSTPLQSRTIPSSISAARPLPAQTSFGFASHRDRRPRILLAHSAGFLPSSLPTKTHAPGCHYLGIQDVHFHELKTSLQTSTAPERFPGNQELVAGRGWGVATNAQGQCAARWRKGQGGWHPGHGLCNDLGFCAETCKEGTMATR